MEEFTEMELDEIKELFEERKKKLENKLHFVNSILDKCKGAKKR